MPGTCILKSTGQRGYYQNVSECRDTDSIIEDTSTAPIPGATVTENAPYASDTRPVAVGYTTYNPGVGSRPAMTTVYEGVRNFERIAGAALSRNASQRDKDAFNVLLGDLRRVTGSELGTLNGQRSAYYDLLQYAASSGQNMQDILQGGAVDAGEEDLGAGPRGVGAYTGPRTTTSVSVTAKEDVKRTLNSFAVDMLGRNLTDEELRKYTAEYREQERGAPRVTTTTPQGPAATTSVTEETVSRETIARNILQDNPMFADNVIKTDVLDMFFNRLGGASSGS